MSRRPFITCLVVPLAGAIACGDGGNTDGGAESAEASAEASTGTDAGLCAWPGDFASSGDESALGCWAHAISAPCELQSGDVVGPNGIILGPDNEPAADQSCRSACVATEFALHCIGGYSWPDSGCQTRTIPAPHSSLGCRLLPLPTTGTDNYYCCPCGQGQAGLADASVMVSTICDE
jgi:hypothetical protein